VRSYAFTGSLRKITAVITTACFLFTIVGSQALMAVVSPQQETTKTRQPLNELFIPFNVGKITDGCFFGSGRVVIAIQDLHCHAQTQMNIR
jgi:hypothetical protein